MKGLLEGKPYVLLGRDGTQDPLPVCQWQMKVSVLGYFVDCWVGEHPNR